MDKEMGTHMAFAWWTQWRVGRLFERVGAGCQFRGGSVEVKGHVELGAECVLGNNLLFRTHKVGAIALGDGVEVDDYAMLLANSRIHIGPQSYIGPYCVLRDTNHLFQGTDVHWRLTPHITKPITIGARCFIGARAYIMPGVTIGDGAVVGPASVVTRDIPAGEFWAGNPSRFIADRQDPSRRARLRRDLELGVLFGLEMPDQKDDAPGA
jgi:acetyltransferase-like isoleucine patch superfamily enzyme